MSHDTPKDAAASHDADTSGQQRDYRLNERHARDGEEAPVPTRVHYHKSERELELGYADGQSFRLSTEFLRVMSPSAEVRGHGVGQETLQVGMRYVGLTNITQSGRYALKLHFDDGHDSDLGIPVGIGQSPRRHVGLLPASAGRGRRLARTTGHSAQPAVSH